MQQDSQSTRQGDGVSSGSFDFTGVTGDIIFNQVKNAGHVAVGKGVTQKVAEAPPASRDNDKQVIADAFAGLGAKVNQLAMSDTEKVKAQAQLELLQDEFLGSETPPDRAMVAKMAEKLAKSAPGLAVDLRALLALPAVQLALLAGEH